MKSLHFSFFLLVLISYHHTTINGFLSAPVRVPSFCKIGKDSSSSTKFSPISPFSTSSLNNNSPEDGREKAFREEQEFIKKINEEILQETGFELEDLINPSKVVNLRRDIIKLEKDLDNINDSTKRQEIEKKIQNKRSTYLIESRAVMRSWLKNLFVIQSVIAAIISLGLVTNTIPGYDLPLSFQVLGFWMWWLFIIPSLRARKPRAQEKDALNISFLINPLVTLILPIFTKDVVLIWEANLLTFVLCYVYGFTKKPKEVEDSSPKDIEGTNVPPSENTEWWVQAWKALDYGSGQERGLRK